MNHISQSRLPIQAVVCDFANVLLLPAGERPTSFDRFYNELVAYGPVNLLDHFELNRPLLRVLSELRPHLPVYLFTGGDIHELPEVAGQLGRVFTAQFSPRQIAYSKSDVQAYRKLAALARLQPETTLFIDDSAANIQAARTAGLQTHLFEDNEAILPLLRALQR